MGSITEEMRNLDRFIEMQNRDWEEHCRQIGFLGRFFEKIFGSQFAHQQLIEFRRFCDNGYKL